MKRLYPWKKWMNRKRLVLVRGRDFSCQPHGMACQIRNAAVRYNRRVSITINGDTIEAVIYPKS